MGGTRFAGLLMVKRVFAEGIRDPEVCLWRSVVERAIIDALSDKVIEHGVASSHPTYGDKLSARIWLSKRSDDFDDVCGLAGYDPDAVLKYYKRIRLSLESGEVKND